MFARLRNGCNNLPSCDNQFTSWLHQLHCRHLLSSPQSFIASAIGVATQTTQYIYYYNRHEGLNIDCINH
jgi:hypothetical protein